MPIQSHVVGCRWNEVEELITGKGLPVTLACFMSQLRCPCVLGALESWSRFVLSPPDLNTKKDQGKSPYLADRAPSEVVLKARNLYRQFIYSSTRRSNQMYATACDASGSMFHSRISRGTIWPMRGVAYDARLFALINTDLCQRVETACFFATAATP